jgi:hypothetical protein
VYRQFPRAKIARGCIVTYQIISYRGDHSLYGGYIETGIIPGLGGFCLEFSNTDHHVNSLIVGGVTSDGTLRDFDSYLLGFSDNDHASLLGTSDPVDLWAKVYPVGPGPTFVASGSGTGSGEVSVPVTAFADDDLFYLRGFSFLARNHTNHHIRRIAIRHDKATSMIRVVLHDDSPDDDEFRFSVLFSSVLHANRTGRTASRYFEGPFHQSLDFTNTARVNKVMPGLSILSGFDFRFDDNDHHLRKVAIDPVSLEQFAVTFTDDERDNRVSGALEYITLQHTLR